MADKPDEATDPGATVESEALEGTDPLAETAESEPGLDREPTDPGLDDDDDDDDDTSVGFAPLGPDTAESPRLTDEATDPQPGEAGSVTAKGVGQDWGDPTAPGAEPRPEGSWPAPFPARADKEEGTWVDVTEREPTEPHPGDAGSITAKGVGEWAPEVQEEADPVPSVLAEGAESERVERTVRLDLAQQDELMRLRAQQDEALRERFQREVVVMFTDMAGSTAYYEKYGDLAGRQKMLTHNALLFPVVRAQNGTVVKTLGDSIMACFDNAGQALTAAAEMQHTLAEFNTAVVKDDDAILIRIGLNAGLAIPERGDLHGDVVNVAARIEEHAQAGEVLLADSVAREAGDWPLVLVGPVPLKGRREPLVLHRLKWKEETTGRGEQIKGPELPDHLRPRYHLQGTVDRGPIGVVYLARDVKRDAPVAIKLLYRFATETPEARRFFRDQMWTNAQLQHDSIARVFEFSASREDRAYVVSEYVDGINLAQHVAQSGCPSMHELARIGFQAASALEHAHQHGCIHGDVKPENVLLTPEGNVKLTDFGLVGLWTDKPSGDPMTSPAFMAPQALGGRTTDPRVDVYSLGALLYFLAVGHGPVEGDNEATVVTMRAVVSGRIRPLSHANAELPAELIAIVDKATAPTAGSRIQTMSDLRTRLAAFLESLGPEEEPPARPAADAGKTRITSPAIEATANPEATKRTNLAAMLDARRRRRRPMLVALGVLALIPLLIAAILLATRPRGCTAVELPPPATVAPLPSP